VSKKICIATDIPCVLERQPGSEPPAKAFLRGELRWLVAVGEFATSSGGAGGVAHGIRTASVGAHDLIAVRSTIANQMIVTAQNFGSERLIAR
jgi:hypothetical protein